MAQQTAVEWFYQRILAKDIKEVYAQAKQMEKQQLANTWDAACDSYILLEGNLVKVWKDFDKYYNETYSKHKDRPYTDDIK